MDDQKQAGRQEQDGDGYTIINVGGTGYTAAALLKIGISPTQEIKIMVRWVELYQRCGARGLEVAKKLHAQKCRSPFKMSLQQQLDSWLSGDSDFHTPFSAKQWKCLTTPWHPKRSYHDDKVRFGTAYREEGDWQ